MKGWFRLNLLEEKLLEIVPTLFARRITIWRGNGWLLKSKPDYSGYCRDGMDYALRDCLRDVLACTNENSRCELELFYDRVLSVRRTMRGKRLTVEIEGDEWEDSNGFMFNFGDNPTIVSSVTVFSEGIVKKTSYDVPMEKAERLLVRFFDKKVIPFCHDE